MRRGFSILLIFLFGLGPLSATLEGNDEAGLPACCRRHGAHHCAVSMQMADSGVQAQSQSAPVLSAPLTCPAYPGSAAVITGPGSALVAAAANLPILAARTYKSTTIAAVVLSNPSRTHAGRGPPSQS